MLHFKPKNAAIPERIGLRPRSIVTHGKNCGHVEIARRAAVLVDGDAYFSRLAQCLPHARRSIIIVAWDFDGAIRLQPSSSAETVGTLLRSLVDRWPDLHVRILVWSEATIHAPGATLPLLLGDEWSNHPRISVRLDQHHPIYAAHHQKIVTIDDELAFVGGMDLTVDRWDTPAHEPECERRVKPDGKPYGPVHDVQMVLEGAAARALAEIARHRWRTAVGDDIPPCSGSSEAWPSDLTPQFVDVPIAISTVSPQWRGDKGCAHSLQMTLDAIEAAKNSIYIEAQYFTSRRVGRAIAKSLAKPKGPNILVIVGLNSHGFIEHYVMARNRDRLARKLIKRDPYKRFRIYYPMLPSGKDLNLHSKVMVVDDTFLRIGSSNLNNRSEGLDTECDVAIEARDEHVRSAIVGVRDGLIAEHLGAEPGAVSRAIDEEGGLFAAIDRLNVNPRALKPLPELSHGGPTHSVFGTWLLDPASPWFRRFRFN